MARNFYTHITPETLSNCAKQYEITPNDGRKSFYGKAKVFVVDGVEYLQSYNTIVCALRLTSDDCGGVFVRCWDGYSATTMRHINAFMERNGLASRGGKSWWMALPAGEWLSYSDILNAGV